MTRKNHSKHRTLVKSMSIKEMEHAAFDILTDNGMHTEDAIDTINSMSTKDLENYLIDAFNERFL